MPIPIADAKRHKGLDATELKIMRFLAKSPKHAFSYNEIWAGIGWSGNQGIIRTIAAAYLFGTALDSLVKKKRIKISEINFVTYYYPA